MAKTEVLSPMEHSNKENASPGNNRRTMSSKGAPHATTSKKCATDRHSDKSFGRSSSKRIGRSPSRSYGRCTMSRGRKRDSVPSVDSEEEYRRSRSRERQRRRTQYKTMLKARSGASGETSQVFWDGFQWVKKGEGAEYNQEMNATRRARRLHIGNIPHRPDCTEEGFKAHLWAAMLAYNVCSDPKTCPLLHVWFARDRGGSFGFVEMATVEDAHAALSLDNIAWKGSSIRINRPTDWKSCGTESAIEKLAGSAGVTLAAAESIAAAAQHSQATGNTGGLMKLVSNLQPEGQQAITEIMKAQEIAGNTVQRDMQMVKEKIETDLLNGAPTRVIRMERPAKAETPAELQDVLEEIIEECEKLGQIVSALVVSPGKPGVLPPGVGLGDVFIEFARMQDADTYILSQSGRLFEGTPLRVHRYDTEIWTSTFKPLAENVMLKKLYAKGVIVQR